MTPDSDPDRLAQIEELLTRVAARLRALTTVVALMALAVLLLMAVQYGSLVNYWAGDALFYGATSTGAALLGFGLGWLAGRRR